jgi:iron complex transport system substrate-binding protein
MVTVLVCALFLTCRQNRSSDGGDTRMIVDMKGRTVTIPKTVDKVFVDWVQGTLHMMTLGALDKVVAVRTAFDGDIFTWARTIYPNFDSVQKDDAPFTNIEALLAYEPDIIFSLNDEDSRNYEGIDIPIIAVSFTDYNEFRQAMRIIGDVLGGEYAVKATRFIDFFDANIALVSERLANVDDAEKK